MKKITIDHIAEILGLSTATVSRALNGQGPMKESTRQKVIEVARQLNYHGMGNTSSPVKNSTKSIGVIIPQFDNSFFSSFLHLIDQACKDSDIIPYFCSHSYSHEKSQRLLLSLKQNNADGLIIIDPGLNTRLADFITTIDLPAVSIYSSTNSFPSVVQDNFNGMKKLTKHFINHHKCTKFAFVKGPDGNIDATERLEGFSKALNNAGLSIDSENIFPGEFDEVSGYRALKELSQKELPEVVIFANDTMVLGGFRAAKELKISIPYQLKFGGYDNFYLPNQLPLSLTTVHQPMKEICHQAVKTLIELIDSHEKSSAESHKIAGAVVLGQSCGCK